MAALPKFLLDCAKDPAIDAAKFAALVSAYNLEQAQASIAAFTKAFHAMAPDLPVIDERGTISYRDGREGTYALNEDIQQAIAPILWKHGFTLSFETTHPSPSAIKVTAVLTHRGGHTRTSSFESSADTSGGKTVAQGRGSIMSYGHRYTSIDVLNLITRGVDDDGASSAKPEPEDTRPVPEGFAFFVSTLNMAADAGSAQLALAWERGTAEQRARVPATTWNRLKEESEAADAIL